MDIKVLISIEGQGHRVGIKPVDDIDVEVIETLIAFWTTSNPQFSVNAVAQNNPMFRSEDIVVTVLFLKSGEHQVKLEKNQITG